MLISDLIDHNIPFMFSFQDRRHRCIKPLFIPVSLDSPIV